MSERDDAGHSQRRMQVPRESSYSVSGYTHTFGAPERRKAAASHQAGQAAPSSTGSMPRTGNRVRVEYDRREDFRNAPRQGSQNGYDAGSLAASSAERRRHAASPNSRARISAAAGSASARRSAGARSGSRTRQSQASTRSGQRSSYRSGSAAGVSVRAIGDTSRSFNVRAIVLAVFAVVVIVAAIFGIRAAVEALSPTIALAVNDERVSVPRGSTVNDVVELSQVRAVPGRLLAVDGSLLDQAGGHAYSATINGQPAAPETVVNSRDELVIGPGRDKTEESSIYKATIAYSVADDGSVGSIHEVVPGGAQSQATMEVGLVSGTIVEKIAAAEPLPATLTRYTIRPSRKAVALTFDDGPWDRWTEEVLDVLKEHDAKATFFVVGTEVLEDQAHMDLVKRESDEGHLVCSHTWSHAAGSGGSVNLGLMSYDEQVNEVVKGQRAIAQATGKPASRVLRAPGGNYSPETAQIVAPYVSYEIGWNIDSGDWKQPGAEYVVNLLLQAEAGDVILLHDGGGDRSQTVEALKQALPQLKEAGFEFVTIDELIAMKDGAHLATSWDDTAPPPTDEYGNPAGDGPLTVSAEGGEDVSAGDDATSVQDSAYGGGHGGGHDGDRGGGKKDKEHR